MTAVTLLRDMVSTLRAAPREALSTLIVCAAAGVTGYFILLLGQ